MGKTAVTTPHIAPPVGPFSPAVGSAGTFYLSGQIAQDPATGRLIEGGVSEQTERIFRNIGALLEAARLSFDDVLRVGVYLADMGDFAEMNAIYEQHFRPPYPARSTIAVAALPLGARVEIDLVAG